jgi:uncharacterized protein YjiS (DUF1127 family)
MMKTNEVNAMQALTLRRPPSSIRFAPFLKIEAEQNIFLLWLDRQRQRIHLFKLDHRLLQDIGVSRSAAEREARRWD